jgi:hypothetical protein
LKELLESLHRCRCYVDSIEVFFHRHGAYSESPNGELWTIKKRVIETAGIVFATNCDDSGTACLNKILRPQGQFAHWPRRGISCRSFTGEAEIVAQ